MLSTVSVAATSNQMPDVLRALNGGRSNGDVELVRGASEALVHGYSVALIVGAVALLLAALVTVGLVTARKREVTPEGASHLD